MGNIIDQLGKTVSVYKITESLNDYGDVTKSTLTTTLTVAEIQPLNGNESEVRVGVLKTGDAIGFFSPSENIERGDEVSYQGTIYTVSGIILDQIGSSEILKEVQLKNTMK